MAIPNGIGPRPRLMLSVVVLFVSTFGMAGSPSTSAPKGDSLTSFAVSGDYVFFVYGTTARVANFQDLAAPSVIGELALPESSVQDIEVANGYAYVAAWKVYVIDVADPRHWHQVRTIDFGGYVADIAIEGDYMYVAAWDGLHILSIHDPGNPVAAGYCSSVCDLDAVRVFGHCAYAAGHRVCHTNNESVLKIVDVQSPSAPLELGHHELPSDYDVISDIDETNGYAYIPQHFIWHNRAFYVVDVRTPQAMQGYALSCFSGIGCYTSAVYGNRLYVSTDSGLARLDITDPSTPVLLGTHTGIRNGYEARLVGDRLYMRASGKMIIVSLADKDSPVLIGECPATLTLEPPNVITASRAGFIEEGRTLRLTAPTGSNYQWKRNDSTLTDDARRSGVNSQTLSFAPVTMADEGTYTCVYTTVTKAVRETEPYGLKVYEAGSVPLEGPPVIVVLVLLLGITGTVYSRTCRMGTQL